jgi:hypothetical protein
VYFSSVTYFNSVFIQVKFEIKLIQFPLYFLATPFFLFLSLFHFMFDTTLESKNSKEFS